MKRKKILKILIAAVIVIIAGVIFSCSVKKKTTAPEEGFVSEETESTEEVSVEEESAKSICIHVCGHVKAPGVYFFNDTVRIHEAVEAAGGFTEEADAQYLNLASVAEDGEQIYIPSKEETLSGKFALSDNSGDDSDGLVDINKATADDLKSLPGIGDIKADAIISYREDVGTFSSIEEIKNVAGIKDSAFEKIKDYIKV